MICPPCADEADYVAEINAIEPGHLPRSHDPKVCRDAAVQGHGCTCQHGAEAGR